VPAVFELKGTSPLSGLIRWAGGLATTAEGQKVTVERIHDRKLRNLEEFRLDPKDGWPPGSAFGTDVDPYRGLQIEKCYVEKVLPSFDSVAPSEA